jgi:hypothetical protein
MFLLLFGQPITKGFPYVLIHSKPSAPLTESPFECYGADLICRRLQKILLNPNRLDGKAASIFLLPQARHGLNW